MKYVILCAMAILASCQCMAQEADGYHLVWSEEFNEPGKPDPAKWNYEKGFVRNHEWQYYQEDNTCVHDGMLTITAREEKGREGIECTSSSINTRGKFEFLYGRLEVRARIPYAKGAWPAIWTLGSTWPWPSGGEIDIMEFYHIDGVPTILANFAHGSDEQYKAVWNSSTTPYAHFLERDPYFSDKFHVWRMDWDADSIALFLDGELLNRIDISKTINGKLGDHKSPFRTPQYILLNLAMGGDHGGEVDKAAMPICYDVDWVRVYQK